VVIVVDLIMAYCNEICIL